MKQMVTRSHDEIERWARRYSGRPEVIVGEDDMVIGVSLNFPGRRSTAAPEYYDDLSPVTWPEFFDYFEQLQLVFMHPERVPLGSHPADVCSFAEAEPFRSAANE